MTIMKRRNSFLLALAVGAGVLASRPAAASLYGFSGPDGNGTYSSGTISPGVVIPDNSPYGGVSFGFNFTATGLSIGAVTLALNMSGGYNGDMYGYLQHNGTLIELFNPSSFSANGASGSTLNLTLSSGSATALSTATAANLAGGLTYAASGGLNNFANTDPAGLWTLYFADQGPGDVMTLNSFDLSITPVPEPVNVALVIFGVGFVGFGIIRYVRNSRKSALRSPQLTA
jgi:hypothetical protein